MTRVPTRGSPKIGDGRSTNLAIPSGGRERSRSKSRSRSRKKRKRKRRRRRSRHGEFWVNGTGVLGLVIHGAGH